MSVPDAAVSYLLENIVQILKYNYSLVADVGDNIRELQKELESLEGLMKDVAKYNHDSEFLKNMVRRIKSVIEEAEDAVDTYVVQAAVQKSKSWVNKAFHIVDYPMKLREVGKTIQDTRAEVRRCVDKAKDIAVPMLLNQSERRKLTQFSMPKEDPKVEEEHVVGFEGAIKHVSQLLTGGSEKLEVISIVGMLGLGKTTLAKKVFNDQKVDFEYMVRVFVYVSREYDRKEVFIKILRSLKDFRNFSQYSGDELEKYLKEKLKGKQYLIVLDDIWEKEDWNNLKDAFPDNDKRCRVLITTRHQKLAEHAQNSTTPIYKLDFLTLEKSRELLCWKVFRHNSLPEKMKDFELEIATKCAGLPLAIVVIAGILFDHRDRVDWWKRVADSVEDYIARDQQQITKVIDLMYMHLPNHLKVCFVYMGMFPDDYEIPVWKLMRLWVAEGLIRSRGALDLEDIAEDYLEELVYRNVVMVGKRRSNDRIKTCILHDTLREFCKKQAAQEKLFTEIKKNRPDADDYRRLCINNANVAQFIASPPPGRCVRSLLTFTREEMNVDPQHVSTIPKTFKLLRVLEIQKLKLQRFPTEMNHLILLKYIAISSRFSSLPKTMSALWSLQTLIASTDASVLKVEADIWQLPQFRHLHTNTSTILPPLDSKTTQKRENVRVQDIQTLSTIAPESCTKEAFERSPKLKKLGIRGKLAQLFEGSSERSSLFSNHNALGSLEVLRLVNDDANSKLSGLPSDSSFPKQLTKLTLSGTRLDWQEMRKLGMLENLEILKLKDHAFEGKKWLVEPGGFKELKHLHIGTTELEEWEASASDFPRLKCLEVYFCYELKAIPGDFTEITSLQSVFLHCTNKEVASSASKLQAKGGEKAAKFKLSVYPPSHLKDSGEE